MSRSSEPDYIARAELLAPRFAARAAEHDRDGSFPFENFEELSEAGLLALTVPAALGGGRRGRRDSRAHPRHHRQGRSVDRAGAVDALHPASGDGAEHDAGRAGCRASWRGRRSKAWRSINALRVEPDLGSPARGGLPATIARRTETGWRLTGRKIYSTGAPILKWYAVWAKTDESEPRVGLFLVPAGLPGTRIVETWDHLGLRASGSHDVVFDDVVFPLDHEIDVRKPDDWRVPDFTQATVHAIFVAAIYDGVARAARDWLVEFLKSACHPTSARRWRPCRARRKWSAASRRGLPSMRA